MGTGLHAIQVVVDAVLVFAAMLAGIGIVLESSVLTLLLLASVLVWVFVILRLVEKYDARDPFIF